MEKQTRLRKKTISKLLEYWPLISTGAHSVDRDDKGEVAIVQKVLTATGHYDGEIDGEYNPSTDGARWRFVKDIMQDADFSFELVKQNAKDIGDMMEELGLEEEKYG
tara:strand:- start:1112 stop:1432 length:321 start_codon:yes stop_codon:yes gene_type:complete